MRRAVVVGVVAVVLLSAPGCGGSADGLMRDTIAGMNKLSESIERDDPAEKQQQLADKVKAATDRLERATMTEEQREALVEKHKDELIKAVSRLSAAIQSGKSKLEGPNPYKEK